MVFIDSEETKYIKKEMKEELNNILSSCLDDREEYIIRSRYEIDREFKSYRAMEPVFNISYERIRKLNIRAVHKLRKAMDGFNDVYDV